MEAQMRVAFVLLAVLLNSLATGWRTVTIAGTGEAGYSGDNGPGGEARGNNPLGIARGPDGALYVCEVGNHVIRRIATDGTISTVAGSGKAGYSGDGGSPTLAQLNEPY